MRKFVLGFITFFLAFVILSVSVLESSSVSYVLATPIPFKNITESELINVDYQMPSPGKILPDSPFWFLKAARDKVRYFLTSSHLEKAELALLFSDKRLLLSKTLLENKKPEIALSTLTKGEKYLEIAAKEEEVARSNGIDTTDFLTKLATASLKHREIIEELLNSIPEDGKPQVIKTGDYSKHSYNISRDVLSSKGKTVPKNPFDGN